MKMRPGRATRIAHESDGAPWIHFGSLRRKDAFQMRVDGDVSAGMLNEHCSSVTTEPSGADHASRTRGADEYTRRAAEIDTRMKTHRAVPEDRVAPITKRTRHDDG